MGAERGTFCGGASALVYRHAGGRAELPSQPADHLPRFEGGDCILSSREIIPIICVTTGGRSLHIYVCYPLIDKHNVASYTKY